MDAIFSIVITLVSLAVTGVVGYLMWRRFQPMIAGANQLVANLNQQAMLRNQLLATGMDAQAQVQSVQQTGTFVNMAPEVVVSLLVAVAGGQPYPVQLRTVVQMVNLPRLQPGQVIPVKVDRGNAQNVAMLV
jgi:hypothetical protein